MPGKQNAAKPLRTIGFRTAILQLVLGALLFTVGTIAIVGYINSARTLDDLRQGHFSLVSLALSREVERLLEPAERILPELRDLTDRGLIKSTDSGSLASFLGTLLREETNLSALSYSDTATGGFIEATRDSEGRIVFNEVDRARGYGRIMKFRLNNDSSLSIQGGAGASSYDPRTEPWYQDAVRTWGRIVWTKPYTFSDGISGIKACIASSAGVYTADFSTTDIDEFLRRLIQGRRLLLFIDTPSGGSLGSASGLSIPADSVLERFRAAYRPGLADLNSGRVSSHSLALEGESYFLVVTPFTLQSGLNFLTGVAGPDSDFLGSAQQNLALTAVIGLAAILGGTLLAIWLAHQLAKPLTKLSRDLEQVGQFRLTNLPPPRSTVREIAIVGDSFERMKAGLRSFMKYVPRDIVRELVLQKQDAARGGALRRLTLFFSDVADFTRISEKLSDSEVFAELGDYFELVTEIIVDKCGGTLDKFVGDGIVAFFNAPSEIRNHAEIGCRAALEILAELSQIEEERRAAGRPVFRTRIGLHTGEVLVGNIGTSHRLAYSVLGDAVNLTSRLEGLNKLYGTSILASRDTKEETGSVFEWRYIDRVAVRGRTKSTDVFELIGYSGSVATMKLQIRDEYETGLEKYFAKDFESATAQFEAVLRRDPQNNAARVLLARCSELSRQALPAIWSGVYEILEK
jgi:adenylate cyclase